MIKKTMLLAMAIGVLTAFVAPAVAGAQRLTDGTGAVPLAAEVRATSANMKATTMGGTLECKEVAIHAEVTVNNSTTSALSAPEGNVTFIECLLNQIPVTVTKGAVSIHITENGAATSSVTFVLDIGPDPPILSTCHFSGTPGGNYATNTDVLSLKGNIAVAGAGCPMAWVISSDFTLETASSEPVIID